MGGDWPDGEELSMDDDEESTGEHDTLELLILHREVQDPMHVKIEAHVQKDGTFIKFWHVPRGERAFHHMYLDSMEPEPILNALVQRIEEGRFSGLVSFINTVGKAIRDPIEFRLKLDSYMGITGADLPLSRDNSDSDDDVF